MALSVGEHSFQRSGTGPKNESRRAKEEQVVTQADGARQMPLTYAEAAAGLRSSKKVRDKDARKVHFGSEDVVLTSKEESSNSV